MPAAQAMPTMLSPDGFVAGLSPGRRMFIAGCAGEPLAVLEALARRPGALLGTTLLGMPIASINRWDLAALAPVETAFMTPELRSGIGTGRVRFRPLHYSDAFAWLRGPACVDMAVFRCAAPRNGSVSLSLAHDFVPALIEAGAELVGVVDPALPDVPDGIRIPLHRLHALVDGPSASPVVQADAASATMDAIGLSVASLVRDGDTVQAGIGTAVTAAMSSLRSHRRLCFHGGIIADPVLDLLDAGALDHATTGVAIGSAGFYERLASDGRIAFRPVSVTHDAARLAALPSLIAVNSAIEVDLFGQVNSEMIGGRQVSGHGGVADFVRGARRSANGRAVIVLAATGREGKVSRIVSRLPAGAPVSVTRADIDMVATEHGIAVLRDADIDERAQRLIAIAAPNFRNSLSDDWDQLRRAM